jgi:hypothetical protein
MEDNDLSRDPCTETARKMSIARETLANSRSQDERTLALREYEDLRETIAETQFFSEGCFEPGEETNPIIGYR